ncbi:sigma factor [Falsiroseomonas sp. HW251]|uniref:sigma factor n=1 Tax=Falsiroseomonas sp. HW251 TaxID=3390998 RepID=UPI003D315F7E
MTTVALSLADLRRLHAVAQREARRVRRIARLPSHQVEDIRQEMLLDFLARLPAFDAERGSLEAFATVCFRHRGIRIAERERRERARRHEARLDQPVCDFGQGNMEHLTLEEVIPESEGYAAWCGQQTDAVAAAERRLNLNRASAALDGRDYPICVALADCTPHDLAQRGPLTRSVLYRRLQEMRLRLLAAGLFA